METKNNKRAQNFIKRNLIKTWALYRRHGNEKQ